MPESGGMKPEAVAAYALIWVVALSVMILICKVTLSVFID